MGDLGEKYLALVSVCSLISQKTVVTHGSFWDAVCYNCVASPCPPLYVLVKDLSRSGTVPSILGRTVC